jgi:hypothetical protein
MSGERHHLGGGLGRDPSADPTPLDLASFYVEALKYGPGPGKVEAASLGQVVAQMEVLLRDANVTSMTGEQVLGAMEFYARSLTRSLGIPLAFTRSLFLDGLMHGIALAAGLEGEHRDPISPSPGAQLT